VLACSTMLLAKPTSAADVALFFWGWALFAPTWFHVLLHARVDQSYWRKLQKSIGTRCGMLRWLFTWCRRQQVVIEEVSRPDPEVPALHFDTKYPCSAQRQYLICLKKFFITFWRTPAYNATRFSFTVGIALLFGTMFWKLGDKT